MKCREELTVRSIGRGYRTAALILVALTMLALVSGISAQNPASEKIALIAIDPKLEEGVKFYLASPRILYEINWYKSNGYRISSVEGTVSGITKALLNSNVKAITFVGEGGARRPDGRPVSALAGIDAKTWRASMRMELARRYQRNGVPVDEALARGEKDSENFNLDRVVNYSCYSLVDTSIAELFVKPGGMYYGSTVLYTGNPISFIHFIFTDKAQFLLESYQVPGGGVRDEYVMHMHGTVQQRIKPIIRPGWDLSGNWLADGRGRWSIQQNGNSLTVTVSNQPRRRGKVFRGQFTASFKIEVDFSDDRRDCCTATVSENGMVINWSNGSTWRK